MRETKQPSATPIGLIAGVVVVALVALYALWSALGPDSGRDASGRLSVEAAERLLAERMEDIPWRESVARGPVEITPPVEDIAETLPAISQYELVTAPPAGRATVEIFVSTEKSGDGEDGWMREIAAAFNDSGARTSSGARARIRIRKIPSGAGYLYIASGKHRPHAFSPSNALWIEMARARGVTMTRVRERTVGNVAGVVMKSDVAERLRADGGLTVPGILDAVVQGKIVAGYSNPFASSTGLNFLTTVLSTFSGGDPNRLLAPEAVSAFEGFQATVPFVARTTLQMRESVRNDGSLDAFVMEWQTFANTDELSSGYEFIPFGWPHDNPLYAVGDLTDDQAEALELFADYALSEPAQARATEMGFNPTDVRSAAPGPTPDGARLIRAQRIWKERRNAGRPVAAVFVADLSGSMAGGRLALLKEALLSSSGFILRDTSIGLVEFSDDTRVALPIRPFTALHNAAFQSAVTAMSAGGNTAMYDGVAVALHLLSEHQKDNPDSRPVIVVLTDGEPNQGTTFQQLSPIVEGMRVPIYTMGFEANVAELQRLSGAVEAASIQVTAEDLRFQIADLAQLLF